MAKRGPKVKYTPKIIKELKEKLHEYIAQNDIPIVAEFAYRNKIRRQALYEYKELADTIKTLIDKKETMLEKGALEGKINCTMAIFSLKQLGWKDKSEIEMSGELKTVIRLPAKKAEGAPFG